MVKNTIYSEILYLGFVFEKPPFKITAQNQKSDQLKGKYSSILKPFLDKRL